MQIQESLPKLNSIECCPKCGAKEKPSFINIRTFTYTYKSQTVGRAIDKDPTVMSEWVERECFSCHYVWKEACLDAKELLNSEQNVN